MSTSIVYSNSWSIDYVFTQFLPFTLKALGYGLRSECRLSFFINFPSIRGKPMKPLKSKVSITLDSDIIEKIKQLAEQDDRSFSQYINMILKEHLKDPDINKET